MCISRVKNSGRGIHLGAAPAVLLCGTKGQLADLTNLSHLIMGIGSLTFIENIMVTGHEGKIDANIDTKICFFMFM